MRPIVLYEWIAGSQHDFTRQFQDNEQLFNQAQRFWNHLNGISWFLIIAMLVIGFATAAYYYTAYNNRAGRHYTLPKWSMFMIITFILTFIASAGILSIFATPKLRGAWETELLMSLGNSLYAVVVYFITSVAWCNLGPTNAYRFFKI